jgi:hypothetical protein
MKPQTTILMTVAAISLCTVVGCSRKVDVDKVPVGSDVQVTRQDGGVVDGTLQARDEKTVKVKSSQGTKTVPRAEIADVQVISPDKPAALPPVAKFREYTVPEGTVLHLTLDTAVGSDTSRIEDRVDATLNDAVQIDGVGVLPAGSAVRGSVTEAQPAGKVKGRASLAIRFESIDARGENYPISAAIAMEAASTKKQDITKIGIGAGAGAIIGGIIGGGKGAAAGAAIGGGGGTAVALMTEGKPIELARGASVRVTLSKPVEVRVPIR